MLRNNSFSLFIFKSNELQKFITIILRQRVMTRTAREIPVEIRSEGKSRETVYARKQCIKLKGKMKKEKEIVSIFSTFKNVPKDFSNETRGRQELKYGAES